MHFLQYNQVWVVWTQIWTKTILIRIWFFQAEYWSNLDPSLIEWVKIQFKKIKSKVSSVISCLWKMWQPWYFRTLAGKLCAHFQPEQRAGHLLIRLTQPQHWSNGEVWVGVRKPNGGPISSYSFHRNFEMLSIRKSAGSFNGMCKFKLICNLACCQIIHKNN